MDQIKKLKAYKATYGLASIICIVSLMAWLSAFSYDGRFIKFDFNSPYLLSLKDPQVYQIITSSLIHANLGHLILNIVFLLLFGIALEKKIGGGLTVFVFLITSIVGDLFFIRWGSDLYNFALGSSGGVMGVMGALLVVEPKYKLDIAYLGFGLNGRQIHLIYFSAVSLGIESLLASHSDGIAHLAHGGGLICGLLMGLIYRLCIRAQHP
ncbi:MAG: rhomboid family intramembrane serine protease [Bdellovibrionales bacterium]|nr:rhomboid family intramembrane serine protease [Bdellovibrionales bacterium]